MTPVVTTLRGSVHRVVCLVTLIVATGAASGVAQTSTRPARIVSTLPSLTETLFALGLGDRVVGVSAMCQYPPEVAGRARIGSALNPSVEHIAALRPDLVVIHRRLAPLARRLASLRLPVVAVEPDTLDGIFETTRAIAEAAGVPARGRALVAEIQARLDVVRRPLTPTAPSVLFIMGRRPGQLADLIGVGRGSFVDDLIRLVGGRNVLALDGQPAYPQISVETVLHLDPAVIIDTVEMGESEAARRERQATTDRLWSAYPTLAAVRGGQIHSATPDAVFIPGPRVAEAAEWFAALLDGGGTP